MGLRFVLNVALVFFFCSASTTKLEGCQCRSVSPPVLSRLKYFKNYWTAMKYLYIYGALKSTVSSGHIASRHS